MFLLIPHSWEPTRNWTMCTDSLLFCSGCFVELCVLWFSKMETSYVRVETNNNKCGIKLLFWLLRSWSDHGLKAFARNAWMCSHWELSRNGTLSLVHFIGSWGSSCLCKFIRATIGQASWQTILRKCPKFSHSLFVSVIKTSYHRLKLWNLLWKMKIYVVGYEEFDL